MHGVRGVTESAVTFRPRQDRERPCVSDRESERLKIEARFHDELARAVGTDAGLDELTSRFVTAGTPGGDLLDDNPSMARRLLDWLGNVRLKRVLVLGCGYDPAAVWFARQGAEVTAIDISPESIELQQRILDLIGLTNVRTSVADAHNTGLSAGYFDVIYGNAILHHLDLPVAINEIRRLLNPGGVALFRDVQAGNFLLRLFRRVTPFWRTRDEHPLTPTDVALIERVFPVCQTSAAIMLALPYRLMRRLCNVTFQRLGTRLRIPRARRLMQWCDRADQSLFSLAPRLRSQAWLCLIAVRSADRRVLDCMEDAPCSSTSE